MDEATVTNDHLRSSNCTNPLNLSNLLPDWQDAGYIAYATVMFIILTFGFFGNVLTITVLCQPSHRKQTLTPLMLNLAVANLFVTVFGYPTMMSVILTGGDINADTARCSWYGFVNGAMGIASIATFTAMTLVLSYSMHQMNPRFRVPRKIIVCLIAASWIYGVVSMLPPLLGWSRFVPGAARIGCGPDWTDVSAPGMAYSLLLLAAGFCVPLSAISLSYIKIFRLLRRDLVPQNIRIQLRRRQWQMKLLRLTAVAIAAFILSWSPYCFVSVLSVFRGDNVLSPGEAEVPGLMAKASVIYNPIVYIVMNRRFRMTLRTNLSCMSCKRRVSKGLTVVYSSKESSVTLTKF